jgi:glycosyltransferase involved in cell wall biosynthesis
MAVVRGDDEPDRRCSLGEISGAFLIFRERMAKNPGLQVGHNGRSPQGASTSRVIGPARTGTLFPVRARGSQREAIRESDASKRPAAARPLSGGVPPLSLGFVSTYLPTRCGLATFTSSLAQALELASHDIGIVSCVEEPNTIVHPPGVVAEWVRGSAASLANAAEVLNRYDAVVLQHEFGIFGGVDGVDVLDFVARLEVPVIVVLHTVLPNPSPHQRMIVESLTTLADRVVAQSEVARARLLDSYRVDARRVVVIQHGAHANLTTPFKAPAAGARPRILTWGLIGSGKGIEYAIDAVAKLADLDPRPEYVIMGETHPKVVEQSGEAYRNSLIERAETSGAACLVTFLDGHHDTAAILAEIRRSEIILLPYLSQEQVVSGVLVEAIASGKPVVATAFPHAVELLAEGSGIVVPHEDPDAMAAALRTLLTDPVRAAAAAAAARRQAPSLFWETVGREYEQLAAQIIPRRVAVSL